VEEWAMPTVAAGRALESITANAGDTYTGATSLAVKLTDEAHHTELLEQKTQDCPKGACSFLSTFEHLDLSEKAPGRYVLTLEAKDAAGNSTSIGRIFTLDPGPPEISLSGTLAERAGLPLNASSGELQIAASEADLPSSGVKKINVELDHQRVATHSFDCSSSCQEVQTSYAYHAQRDGAERSLQTPALPSGSTLTSLAGVSCATKSDCQAVGYYKNSAGTIVTLAEHWNGTAWTAQATPNPSGALESKLEGVSCTSASSCTAVGYYKAGTEAFSAFAERWNGTAWSLTSIANPVGFAKAYLYGVSCGASTDCWGVGRVVPNEAQAIEGKKTSALLEHWNGSVWVQVSATGALTQLKGVSCPSTTSCMAVSGQSGLVAEARNGTSWTSQTMANPGGGSGTKMMGVSCSTSSACAAAGSYTVSGHSAPLVERWNGSSWSVQATPDPVGVVEEVTSSNLEGVSCPSASACTAVGVRRTSHETMPLVESWDGSEWALQPPAIPSGTETASLFSVACSAPFECAAVGSHVSTGTQALIEREGGEGGKYHTLTVEAIDRYGNAESTSIAVEVPEERGETPECSHKATSVSPQGVVSPSEAASSIEEVLPTAVKSSQPTTDEVSGKNLDPTYSRPSPNLESEQTLAEGETSVLPAGGFALKGIACLSPVQTTSAATEAKVVEGAAAVFANTAPETDMVIRPTTYGTTVIQSLRGSNAPTSYSWHVVLNPNEKLIKLPSGAVAVTQAGSKGGEGVEVPPAPESLHSGQVLDGAAAQLEVGEYELTKAEAETTEVIVAVIPHPWVVLRQESIMPLELRVEPDKEVPTEFTLTYTMPPFEPNFTPEAVVTEATASISAVVNGNCLEESPCGTFDSSGAAQYAEYFGNPNHDRNRYYHDFGENNCTNFLSQIMARGGMSYMRAYEHGDGSWWYKRYEFPQYPEAERPGEWTESWVEADLLPRHLWQYGLAVIDSSNEPSGWTRGDILAENWYRDGKGTFNHLQFVVGTQQSASGREPLIANESGAGDNYSHKPWAVVKQRIAEQNPAGWNRVPLAVKHTVAVYGAPGAKKHDPANLYGPNGVFQG
jgi:hypothetical protein